MKTFYYIYIISNKINNKKYIGRRKYIGKNINADRYIGSGKNLKKAIKKYGIENFEKEILCECSSYKEICSLEKYYISLYNAIYDKSFYNLHEGGELSGGNLIKNYSDQEKRIIWDKISKTLMGRKQGKNKKKSEHMKKMWENFTSEEKNERLKYIAGYNKGRKMSEDQKEKLRERMIGKGCGEENPFYGKHHTKEQKEKWSMERKGKIPWNKGKKGCQKCSIKAKEIIKEQGKKMKNTIWINDGTKNKRINKENLDNFPNWKKGMI